MDYQEKLRLAKEALDSGSYDKETIEYIFPELKESEDEEIRYFLINFVKINDGVNIPPDNAKKALDWLEKQGKQSPNNKVEPKFHEGDWVVDEVTGSVYRIKNGVEIVTNHKFGYDLTNGGYIGSNKTNYYHLWTIKDAKDGDVLATHLSPEGDWIGIYKESVDILGFKTYCFLNGVGEFVINPNRCRNHGTHGLHPATKEQRNLLFQKMKEAGYEWDGEKKELKKIEQKPADKKYTFNVIPRLLSMIQPTDKAKTYCQKLIDILIQEGYSADAKIVGNCLKQMNGKKVAIATMDKQKPVEWSEEDERMLDSIIEEAMPCSECPDYPTDEEREYFYEGNRKVDWLKSLRERMKNK